MGIHLHPTAELAPRALLPGDPGRALALAQALLDGPRMFNHHRGLWGYTGTATDGRPLTIQSTGMGGPSAAVVLEELSDLGVQVVVRVGTCGALVEDVTHGDLVISREVLGVEGTSRALGAPERQAADPGLTAALEAAARAAGGTARAGLTVSTDLFYDPDPGRADAWRAAGALAVEMEAATLLAVAARRSIRAACVLAVSDVLGANGRDRIDEEGLLRAGERAGGVAMAALAAGDRP